MPSRKAVGYSTTLLTAPLIIVMGTGVMYPVLHTVGEGFSGADCV
jgi:hypothetical protein